MNNNSYHTYEGLLILLIIKIISMIIMAITKDLYPSTNLSFGIHGN